MPFFVFSIPSPGAKSPSRILSKLQSLFATQSQCGTDDGCRTSQTKNPPPKDFLKAFARTNADFFDVFQKIPTFCLRQNKHNSCARILVRYMWHLQNFVVCFFNSRDAYWTEPKSIPREIETICRKLKKFPLAKPFVPQKIIKRSERRRLH